MLSVEIGNNNKSQSRIKELSLYIASCFRNSKLQKSFEAL